MKTRMVDGVMHEEIDWVDGFMSDDENIIHLKPIKKPKKTLVEVIADKLQYSTAQYREYNPTLTTVLDAIEERLSALEDAAKK